ncbi:MAG: enoyl-CoA hydratase-related protein [candidate division Zixibacteria bacterium]|nr:enoyl-CoA hydratase-related protein [candidate division Zixibacteria bacterium]
MSAFKNLIIETKGRVLVITVSRPTALNAMNIETTDELQRAFNENSNNDAISCVILTGAGEKSFVAGADINEINALTAQTGYTFSDNGLRLMNTIQYFPKPVIAAINGFALGGGCELALACDIRLASDKAKLGQPEVNLGVIPGYGGSQRLPKLVGRGKAMQMILTGDIISAAEAHRIGLVDEIYPHEELMSKAMQMAETIASRGPIAVKLAKELVNHAQDLYLHAGCDMEKANFAQTCGTADKSEGTGAFLQKRKAAFSGK